MNNIILPKSPYFSDHRGSIETVVKDISFNSVLRIVCKVNSVRANHYHKTSAHACVLTKGALLYYERPVGSLEKPIVLKINRGDVFWTGPNVEHAMKFIESSEMWCFSTGSRDQKNYEEDLVRLDVDLTKL